MSEGSQFYPPAAQSSHHGQEPAQKDGFPQSAHAAFFLF